MTLLVAWAGVDDHGPSSVYITADSRLVSTKAISFNFGRKVFAFTTYPDIVGYCGDVAFPSMAIGQIIDLADNGLLYSKNDSCAMRCSAFLIALKQHFAEYPRGFGCKIFQILCVARELNDHQKFYCRMIEWDISSGWSESDMPMPNTSAVLSALGSGASHFKNRYSKYQSGPTQATSRAVFQCFCNTLFSNDDPSCGGAPQLVGLYRKPKSPPNHFGVIWSGQRYLYGMKVGKLSNYGGVEWRNELFELCNGNTMNRAQTAQPQPDPIRTL